MEVVRHGRVDLTPLLTHSFKLENISDDYRLFAERADGVLKVAIQPQVSKLIAREKSSRNEN